MWRIPLSDLNYDAEEEQAVLDVLRSRWLSMGPRTEEFEAAAAEYLGVRHAIAVTNCTCALELAYRFLLEEKSPARDSKRVVVVPDITFVATANAAAITGARPALCDIRSLKMPGAKADHIKTLLDAAGDRAAGVALVHYAGFDCGAAQVEELCEARGLFLLEDAAHAIGGRTADGRALGTVGRIGCYSFFANKNLATGEGGLLVTNDDEAAAQLRLMRSHGMTSLTYQRHASKGHGYDVVRVGHNYRCTEIVAALALQQLKKLDAGNARRRELYRHYADAFRDEPRLLVPFVDDPQVFQASACHIFPLLCSSPGLRDRIRAALTGAGIQTSHHYPPVHSFTCYRRDHGARMPEGTELGDGFPPNFAAGRSEFPLGAAVHFAARQITLPLHPRLATIEADEIINLVLQTVAAA